MLTVDVYRIQLSTLADPQLVLYQLTSRGAEVIQRLTAENRVIEVRTDNMQVSDSVEVFG